MSVNKLVLHLQFMVTVMIILFSTTPFLTNNYLMVFLYVALMWIIITFFYLAINKLVIRHAKLLIITTIWLMWVFFLFFINYSSAPIGSYFNVFIFYLYIYIMVFIDNFYTIKMKYQLVLFTVGVIIFNLLHNIYLNSIHEYANTVVMTNTSKGAYYKTLNIGATDFSTMIFLFAAIVLIWYLNSNKRLLKLFYIFVISASSYLVLFQHARATSIILYVFLFMTILLSHFLKAHKIKANEKLVLTIGIIGLILVCFVPFLQFVSTIIDNNRLYARIVAILELFRGNLTVSLDDNTLARRIYLVYATLKTFISTPQSIIMGNGYDLISTNSMQEMLAITGVGYHAELIDVLGTYGIIGAYFIFYILIRYHKMLKNKFMACKTNEFNFIYFAFIIYAFLNIAFCPQIGVIIFVLLPFGPMLIEERNYQ